MSEYERDKQTYNEIKERIIDRIDWLNSVPIVCEICGLSINPNKLWANWRRTDDPVICNSCRESANKMKYEEV